MKVNFSEPQGRITLQIDCFLNQDLTNEEIVNVYKELEIEINHPLVAEISVGLINENEEVI